MPASDSEDFESADEGIHEGSSVKKERKKRLSSSNFSDTTQESDQDLQKTTSASTMEPKKSMKNIHETADGWEDFDVEDEKPTVPVKTKLVPQKEQPKSVKKSELPETKVTEVPKESTNSEDTGWDDFDDWGQGDNDVQKEPITVSSPKPATGDADIKSVADRLSAASVKEESKGWGWGGWGVDSLLSSATAGISTITTHVSQGITTVLETGIGAPDPEEMARQSRTSEARSSAADQDKHEEEVRPDDASFQLGNLISGVTKFVETTGTKVIAGGLDTLETIGKKTMEVLQDGDPGLAKKRAMLGLDSGDKVVLSQVLREAKARADEEDRLKEEKREAKEVHYETLFDDFEGLVHLEALEMLSKQVSMRIEERMRSVDGEKRTEIKETLQQVAELCEMPDDDDDDGDDASSAEGSKADAFHERLQEATEDLGLKLQFQPLVKQLTETHTWLDSTTDITEKAVYKRAVSDLAHYTALCVELYHKTGEMLLVKPRRSTADEADALTQMTVVLTRHLSELAARFTELLNSVPSDNKEQNNTYITNVFLEAGNSSTYIQNAFQLALPILQIGAV